MPSPSVCVLLPCLDEIQHIDDCLTSLHGQSYDGPLEIIVADGGSTDGTMESLDAWATRSPSVLVIANTERIQSAGIWKAALATNAAILVRADAHTVYAPDYISRSVDALATSEAVAVGGRLHPVASTPFGKAVSQAMVHPLGIGPGGFHSQAHKGLVDTVYLGTFRREDFLAIGGMRTLPSGVAEDADLYYRWRRHGRTILLDPAIRSEYQPRDTRRSLWRQFYRYGLGKADMIIVNGEFPSWRPFAPLLLVAGLIGGTLIVPWTAWPFVTLFATWLLVLAVAMRFRLRVVLAAAIMHISYGLGLIRGLMRRPASVRAAVRENPQPE